MIFARRNRTFPCVHNVTRNVNTQVSRIVVSLQKLVLHPLIINNFATFFVVEQLTFFFQLNEKVNILRKFFRVKIIL